MMRSPFPGMDPFIEGQLARDFHTEFVTAIRAILTPQVLPRYVVQIEALPALVEQRQAYLTVRYRETRDVVTTIELLSPTNKGPDGRDQYLHKREKVLQSPAHLVELDLLRGGTRLPTVEPLPPGDYYAFVSRAPHRPKVAAYAWLLPHPLPPVPIPLAGEDQDVTLDLQAAFNTVYDRAAYAYSLDYGAPIQPPLSDTGAAWAREVMAQAFSPEA